MGMSKKEIARKFDEIVDFAEMADFIDTPVKRYSSGMQVKLAFAVATSIESEILIVDEVLAVGDLAFQRKCFDRMEDLIKRQQRTVLLVSHNIRQVERLCSRTILLDHGQVLHDGSSLEGCDRFYSQADEKIRAQGPALGSRTIETDCIVINRVCFIDGIGNSVDKIIYGKTAIAVVDFKLSRAIYRPTFGIGVHTTDLLYLATQNTESSLVIDIVPPGDYSLRCEIADMPFLPGVYALRVGVTEGDSARTVFYGENMFNFQVIKPWNEDGILTSERSGFVRMDASWTINSAEASANAELSPKFPTAQRAKEPT
jgi:lipopolysaccharide transport system ATP-binding protein